MALTRSERGDLMVQIEDTYKELGQCSPGFDLLETLEFAHSSNDNLTRFDSHAPGKGLNILVMESLGNPGR